MDNIELYQAQGDTRVYVVNKVEGKMWKCPGALFPAYQSKALNIVATLDDIDQMKRNLFWMGDEDTGPDADGY